MPCPAKSALADASYCFNKKLTFDIASDAISSSRLPTDDVISKGSNISSSLFLDATLGATGGPVLEAGVLMSDGAGVGGSGGIGMVMA